MDGRGVERQPRMLVPAPGSVNGGPAAAYNTSVVSSIDRYLAHLELERRVSPHTHAAYALDLGKLATFAAGEGVSVERLGIDALERFVRTLMAEGRSPRSVGRLVASVRGFYRFTSAAEAGENPAADLQAPRAWKALPKFLSVDEVDALLAAPDVAAPRGLRDRALIELLYATGLRVSELLGLTLAQVDLGRRRRDDDGEGAQGAHRAGRR